MTKSEHLLCRIAEDTGLDVDDILGSFDSVCLGICTQCEIVDDSCEPDARANYCEECSANTVKSALVLAGVI
jgi:hypothetical protein